MQLDDLLVQNNAHVEQEKTVLRNFIEKREKLLEKKLVTATKIKNSPTDYVPRVGQPAIAKRLQQQSVFTNQKPILKTINNITCFVHYTIQDQTIFIEVNSKLAAGPLSL